MYMHTQRFLIDASEQSSADRFAEFSTDLMCMIDVFDRQSNILLSEYILGDLMTMGRSHASVFLSLFESIQRD